MSNGRDSRKKGIAASGSWVPIPLDFLRSRACASLSPHGAKLLLDVLALLGPNASRNGDLSLVPKVMATRGWSGRETLGAAVAELEEHGLLVQTRQGGRLNCNLYALTLFPIDCDVRKLDAGAVGSFTRRDFEKAGLAQPTEDAPATWRRARKTKTVAPPRDATAKSVPPRDEAVARAPPKTGLTSRGGTKTPFSAVCSVPPRVTYVDTHLPSSIPESMH